MSQLYINVPPGRTRQFENKKGPGLLSPGPFDIEAMRFGFGTVLELFFGASLSMISTGYGGSALESNPPALQLHCNTNISLLIS